ncbi:tetratricopeptide repeat protein [Ktedonobacteria bacterium brp13]|nr:tetratricopeptide repeat protein [Ktedonobacteria bacterium brp13]
MRIPWALDQAGAYIEETGCSLSGYLQHYEQQRTCLLDRRGGPGADHPQSVKATFRLSMERVQREHRAASDVLCVCALLHAEAIPEELFVEGAVHLGPELECLTADPSQFDQAVAVLRSLSLVQRQAETRTLSLHRLVQAVLLDALTEAEREQWTWRAIRALDEMFPEVQPTTEYPIWKQCGRLLPHALLCLHRLRNAEDSLVLASLAYKAAQYLRERGQYVEAEPLYQHALHIQEQILGSEHLQVADSLNYLAALYWSQGKYAEAEMLLLRALSIWEQSLDPDHPDMARVLNNLANLSWEQGKYAEAEPRYQRARRIWTRTLGPDHPHVASSLNNLAELYRMQSKYAEAKPLYQRALSIREQSLGPDHPEVATSLNNLAELYRMQSKDAEAEPLYQRALFIREQVLGVTHHLVAEPLNGLANLFRDRGKYAEAKSLYQRALSIREQLLGQHHPETAQTLHDLAIFFHKQRNLCEAFSLAERSLAIRSQSLGDDHPKTVATQAFYDQLVQEREYTEEGGASEQSVEESQDRPGKAYNLERAPRPPLAIAASSQPEQDHFQEFLSACCELHPRAWCHSADLWQTYEHWIEKHQERFLLSRGAFTAQLKARGCRADRTKTARIWRGIALVKKNHD